MSASSSSSLLTSKIPAKACELMLSSEPDMASVCVSHRRGNTYMCESDSKTLYDSVPLSQSVVCRTVEMQRSSRSMKACASAGSSSAGVADVGRFSRRTWWAKGKVGSANGLSVIVFFFFQSVGVRREDGGGGRCD
jgi:hypothetical protein